MKIIVVKFKVLKFIEVYPCCLTVANKLWENKARRNENSIEDTMYTAYS
jgi:hypothetical protein